MKNIAKVLIAGAVIACVGLVVILVTLAVNGWNFTRIEENWEKESYECDESVSSINIELYAGEVKTVFYDGDCVKVEYFKSELFSTDFEVKGDTLSIKTTKLKWYNGSFWFINRRIPTTTVYLPESATFDFDLQVNAGAVDIADGTYGKFTVQLNAGAVNLGNITANDTFKLDINAGAINAKAIACPNFSLDLSAGAVKVSSLACNNIDLDVSAGSAKIDVAGNKSDYNIKAKRSAGSCNVTSQTGADSQKQLKVDVSAGSVDIGFIG